MGVWVMAGVTFREAARKRVLWMALAAGFAFLALFGTGLHFQMKDFVSRDVPLAIRVGARNAMLVAGLYAVDLLTVVMTVLTSVDTLSGEIASGTIQAVATKPIHRWQLLLGKWLGFIGMLAAYIVLMVGGSAAVAHVISGAEVHHLVRGMLLIWMESALLLSVTLLCGTSLSTLTNGVVVLGFHGIAFIGGWIEQVGAVTHSPRAVTVGIVASLMMPSETLWRRAVSEMQSPLLSAIAMSPFSNASVPSLAMVVYAALYLLAALGLAMYRFGRRDL
jgi:ABC-2 type transport system permease protein